MEIDVNRDSDAYVQDPDAPVTIQSTRKKAKVGRSSIGMASIAFATSASCLRLEFIKYLGDQSGNHSKSPTHSDAQMLN